MPMEDGHDQCVHCLGLDHARMASRDPFSCMNCFILPARVREARALAFSCKHPATLIGQTQQAKQPRVVVWNDQVGVESQSHHTLGVAVRNGLAWPSPVAGTAPSTTQHPTSTLVEQGELDIPMSDASDGGEVDILGVDSEGEDLPLGQVCLETKQVEEDQEQPPPLYH